jgi:hypothetical protein
MRNSTQYVYLNGLVLALLCGGAVRSQAAERQIVLLYNQAKVTTETLAEAEGSASRIMRRSEIELQWPACSVHAEEGRSDCREYWDREPLIIQVLPSGGDFPNKRCLGWSSVGADGGSERAVIYMDRMDKFMTSDAPPLSLGQMLGHVMAHEMGHLLLSQVGHTRTGIMISPWGVQQLSDAARGELLFDYAESKKMQAEVKRRLR